MAAAWLQLPSKYPRELSAIVDVLEPGEEVSKVFDCFPGRWSMRGGLLFVTNHRLVYIAYRLLQRRVKSIPFDSISHACAKPFTRELDLVLETTSGKVLTFSRGVGGKKYFDPIFGALAKELGDRFTGMEHLPPENQTVTGTRA